MSTSTTTTTLTTTDPRPRTTVADDGIRVSGWRCTSCRFPLTQEALRCPVCRGSLEEATFSPEGVVFASTCMRVGVPGHPPPYAIGYLVLDDDGPRVFVHTRGDEPLAVGSRARIVAVTGDGDLVAGAAA